MKDFLCVAAILLLPMTCGVLMGWGFTRDVYTDELHAVGIAEIKHCRVITPSVSSNWYEIVWKEDAQCPKRAR